MHDGALSPIGVNTFPPSGASQWPLLKEDDLLSRISTRMPRALMTAEIQKPEDSLQFLRNVSNGTQLSPGAAGIRTEEMCLVLETGCRQDHRAREDVL